jgi:parallel beta-helix repeat protein
MTVTKACLFSIALQGADNQLDMNVVTLGVDGIGIGPGDHNRILSNDVSNHVRIGVEISNSSDNNQVKNNIINNSWLVAGEQGGVAIFNGTGNVPSTTISWASKLSLRGALLGAIA